jgi:alpha-tubulin suppressor-like RCC1 family protein
MEDVSSVAAGVYHACATRLDGRVWCWGGNPNGELGRKTAGVKDSKPAPVLWPAQSSSSP